MTITDFAIGAFIVLIATLALQSLVSLIFYGGLTFCALSATLYVKDMLGDKNNFTLFDGIVFLMTFMAGLSLAAILPIKPLISLVVFGTAIVMAFRYMRLNNQNKILDRHHASQPNQSEGFSCTTVLSCLNPSRLCSAITQQYTPQQ